MKPEDIANQRAMGWPDIHPEDYCHKCGVENPMWYTDRDSWLIATRAWSQETGREGICCPTCFMLMYQEATGRTPLFKLVVP